MISVNVTIHYFYIGFVYVLWKCIWPLLADVKCSFLFCFTVFVYDVGVLEWPNGSIFCIVYWFYTSFTKIDVRVCGGFPVFENCLLYVLFLMISNFVDFIWFCKCFVAGSGRWPGGHRAGTGHWPVLSDAHRPPYNTLSKNPISRA